MGHKECCTIPKLCLVIHRSCANKHSGIYLYRYDLWVSVYLYVCIRSWKECQVVSPCGTLKCGSGVLHLCLVDHTKGMKLFVVSIFLA